MINHIVGYNNNVYVINSWQIVRWTVKHSIIYKIGKVVTTHSLQHELHDITEYDINAMMNENILW